MRRFVLAVVALLACSVVVAGATPAYAATTDPFDRSCEAAGTTEFCDNVDEEKSRSFVYGTNSMLLNIAQTVVLITGAASVIMIIIGGFHYVLSMGDPGATKGAKDTILYAVIGLMVAIFSQIIVSLVLSNFV